MVVTNRGLDDPKQGGLFAFKFPLPKDATDPGVTRHGHDIVVMETPPIPDVAVKAGQNGVLVLGNFRPVAVVAAVGPAAITFAQFKPFTALSTPDGFGGLGKAKRMRRRAIQKAVAVRDGIPT